MPIYPVTHANIWSSHKEYSKKSQWWYHDSWNYTKICTLQDLWVLHAVLIGRCWSPRPPDLRNLHCQYLKNWYKSSTSIKQLFKLMTTIFFFFGMKISIFHWEKIKDKEHQRFTYRQFLKPLYYFYCNSQWLSCLITVPNLHGRET